MRYNWSTVRMINYNRANQISGIFKDLSGLNIPFQIDDLDLRTTAVLSPVTATLLRHLAVQSPMRNRRRKIAAQKWHVLASMQEKEDGCMT